MRTKKQKQSHSKVFSREKISTFIHSTSIYWEPGFFYPGPEQTEVGQTETLSWWSLHSTGEDRHYTKTDYGQCYQEKRSKVGGQIVTRRSKKRDGVNIKWGAIKISGKNILGRGESKGQDQVWYMLGGYENSKEARVAAEQGKGGGRGEVTRTT